LSESETHHGAAAAMFTVVDRLLLEPVRYRDAGRLVSIHLGDAQNAYGVPWLEFEQWQKESRSFEQMALSGSMQRPYLEGKSDLLEVSGNRVSANLFSTLGVDPELGRGFLPEAPGFAPGKNAGTIVLSDAVWRVRGYGDFWSYCLVAEGAVDIAVEPEVKLWDLAPLDVLVREAGGSFTTLDGTSGPHTGSAVATNGLLHDQVLARLSPV